MEKRQSYMPKHIAEEALKEYSEIEKLFNNNKEKTIEELYIVFSAKYNDNAFNYDGELFDIMPNRVAALSQNVTAYPLYYRILIST